MILMKKPSMSLNSHDVPGPNYKMWSTTSMAKGITPGEIIAKIQAVHQAAITSGKRLANIVINCHGSPGSLATGGSGEAGFNINNVSLFAALKPLNVAPIWLVACRAAAGSTGQSFCQKISIEAGTMVVAGEEAQAVTAYQTYRYYLGKEGQIDDYEGTVHIFYPNNTSVRGVDPEEHMGSVLT